MVGGDQGFLGADQGVHRPVLVLAEREQQPGGAAEQVPDQVQRGLHAAARLQFQVPHLPQEREDQRVHPLVAGDTHQVQHLQPRALLQLPEGHQRLHPLQLGGLPQHQDLRGPRNQGLLPQLQEGVHLRYLDHIRGRKAADLHRALPDGRGDGLQRHLLRRYCLDLPS